MRRLAVLVLMVPVLDLPAAPGQAGGFCMTDPLTDRARDSVDIKDNCFFPMVVRIEAGESVTWKSYDVEAHTVTAPGGWGSGHKEYRKGDKASFEFDEEGIYPYVCLYHPGMVGAVVVGDGKGAPFEDGIEQSAPTAPVRDTNEGTPITLVVAITALSLVVIVAAGAWARRRFIAGGSDAVA